MPEFDLTTQTKIENLRALIPNGVEVYELVKVIWPDPTDPIWYSTSIPSEITAALPVEVAPLQVRLMAASTPDWFLPVKVGDEIGDEEVGLKFWDGPDDAGENDGAFGDLLFTHGEGVRVELYYWFPQEELLLLSWHGHLRNEEEADFYTLPVKAVQGFRASEALLPSGGHYEHCNAVFGGLLTTQAEIDENGCPYNKHIGGSVGNFQTGSTPWSFCNRRTTQSCTDRGINPLFHLSHNTIQTVIANGQTKGPTLYSTTFGNQTNLPDPVCVVMGTRRVAGELIAWRRDLNTNHPDKGFFQTLNELCRGPISYITGHWIEIAGVRYNYAFGYSYRLGAFGQTANFNITTHGFSNIANFRQTSDQLDPSTISPSDVKSSAIVAGLSNIRVYTDDDTYFETYTTNRAWQIARMLCDKIWGYGLDYSRLHIPSWIEAAQWCDEYVRFTDPNGDIYDHQRSSSNVELRGKKVQQQIEDMCRAGRLSRPFIFDGKIHIVPLRKLTEEELDACPVFTDEGNAPNIVWDDGAEQSTLRASRISSVDLPNRIECTFDNVADDWKETPLRPTEDLDAQFRAGRAEGSTTRKPDPKKFNLMGVTDEPQAMKVQQALLDLGEFDEGGLMNNCSLTFTIWYLDSLVLHPAKVIKVENARLQARYEFDYFRVMSMERQSDLKVELTVQAYSPEYMETFEVLLSDLVEPPPDDEPLPPDWPFDPYPPLPPVDLPYPIISFGDGILKLV